MQAVIPGRLAEPNPESRNVVRDYVWIPDPRFRRVQE